MDSHKWSGYNNRRSGLPCQCLIMRCGKSYKHQAHSLIFDGEFHLKYGESTNKFANKLSKYFNNRYRYLNSEYYKSVTMKI